MMQFDRTIQEDAMHRKIRGWILFSITLSLCLGSVLAAETVLDSFRALTSARAAGSLPDRSAAGMVVTAEPQATLAGLAALRAGGNAADAAVAAAFALAVTYPRAGNLGGGGFLLYLPPGGTEPLVLDFRETAPALASPGMYQDESGNVIPDASLKGFKAAGIPGTVRGLHDLWKAHGSLPWPDLLAPAITLAEKGFPVPPALARRLKGSRDLLGAFPSSRAVFFQGDRPLAEGNLLVQADLAATLKRIAAAGPDGFYSGETARLLASAMAAGGGLISAQDLESYRAVVRAPIHFTYRGYEVYSMPPPSSGGILLAEIFQILEIYPLARLPQPAYLNLLAEAMRLAFVDRNRLMGDPAFVDVPVARLTSRQHAAELRALIKPGLSLDSAYFRLEEAAPGEGRQTTHLVTADSRGGTVSLTYTLNGNFGCGAVAAGTGVLLNNEMDDFTAKPGAPNLFGLVQGSANDIRPGKRPLSSMTPTIVCRDGRPVLVLGSPGGPTIITAVLQVMLQVLEFRRDLTEALAAPRIHHQWLPDKLVHETAGFSPETLAALRNMGYVVEAESEDGRIGLVEALTLEWSSDGRVRLHGGTDPRGSGLAAGLNSDDIHP
jgi:gamma-glutamyltranspeptidase/glutathione hydrolase